ncbi:hypothetical protein ID866_9955 [Astraeus odoratus]|nr:hypothetical protein ID866_9955 [Astraeus odoratus]
MFHVCHTTCIVVAVVPWLANTELHILCHILLFVMHRPSIPHGSSLPTPLEHAVLPLDEANSKRCRI